MKIFSISDLHLSFGSNKPMDIFGGNWKDYLAKIEQDWQEKVSDEDVVLIAGDISWAMHLNETKDDFEFLNKLKGTKIIIRGNHDYWWSSISAVRNILPKNVFALQNDAIKLGNVIIAGSRGWTVPENSFESEQDEKIYKRELIRFEMSLSSAKRLQTNGEQIICMIHFPPFNTKHENSDFTDLFEKYGVSKVVFGHLHGKKVRKIFDFQKNGVEYFLTSCDQTENKLILISEKK